MKRNQTNGPGFFTREWSPPGATQGGWLPKKKKPKVKKKKDGKGVVFFFGFSNPPPPKTPTPTVYQNRTKPPTGEDEKHACETPQATNAVRRAKKTPLPQNAPMVGFNQTTLFWGVNHPKPPPSPKKNGKPKKKTCLFTG